MSTHTANPQNIERVLGLLAEEYQSNEIDALKEYFSNSLVDGCASRLYVRVVRGMCVNLPDSFARKAESGVPTQLVARVGGASRTVPFEPTSDRAYIEIVDDGIGIPGETSAMFEPRVIDGIEHKLVGFNQWHAYVGSGIRQETEEYDPSKKIGSYGIGHLAGECFGYRVTYISKTSSDKDFTKLMLTHGSPEYSDGPLSPEDRKRIKHYSGLLGEHGTYVRIDNLKDISQFTEKSLLDFIVNYYRSLVIESRRNIEITLEVVNKGEKSVPQRITRSECEYRETKDVKRVWDNREIILPSGHRAYATIFYDYKNIDPNRAVSLRTGDVHPIFNIRDIGRLKKEELLRGLEGRAFGSIRIDFLPLTPNKREFSLNYRILWNELVDAIAGSISELDDDIRRKRPGRSDTRPLPLPGTSGGGTPAPGQQPSGSGAENSNAGGSSGEDYDKAADRMQRIILEGIRHETPSLKADLESHIRAIQGSTEDEIALFGTVMDRINKINLVAVRYFPGDRFKGGAQDKLCRTNEAQTKGGVWSVELLRGHGAYVKPKPSEAPSFYQVRCVTFELQSIARELVESVVSEVDPARALTKKVPELKNHIAHRLGTSFIDVAINRS